VIVVFTVVEDNAFSRNMGFTSGIFLSCQRLCAKGNTNRTPGMDYGLRSAPTIATEITQFCEDRLCHAWRVPF